LEATNGFHVPLSLEAQLEAPFLMMSTEQRSVACKTVHADIIVPGWPRRIDLGESDTKTTLEREGMRRKAMVFGFR